MMNIAALSVAPVVIMCADSFGAVTPAARLRASRIGNDLGSASGM